MTTHSTLATKKWMNHVLQDLVLLFVGVTFLLLTFANLFGEAGLLTLPMACGLMGFALLDFSKSLYSNQDKYEIAHVA
jgi:hypothetical protein